MVRHECPICGTRLIPLQNPDHYLCPSCSLYYKTYYGVLSRPFPIPPWEQEKKSGVKPPPTKQMKQAQTAEEETLTPAQEKWIADTVAQLTYAPHMRRRFAEIIRGAFLGKYKDWWDMIQELRAESGYHIDTIHEAMRKALEVNPEAKKEIAREGAVLPFMVQYVPPEKPSKTKKHTNLKFNYPV